MKNYTFISAAIINEVLIIEEFEGFSFEEAKKDFLQHHEVSPTHVLGPFEKKKLKMIHDVKKIKFLNNNIKKAIYRDWLVNAFLLEEPPNHVYLVFINKIDNTKEVIKPTGTIIVPSSDVRFLDE